MNKERLKNGLEKMGIAADETALDRFEAFHAILDEYNARMDLTAVLDEDERVDRHDLDSAAGARAAYARREGHRRGHGRGLSRHAAADSAAGFADDVFGRAEQAHSVSGRRAGASGAESGDAARARGRRGQNGEQYDAAVSRAVANAATLEELTLPFVQKGGVAIAWKGPGVAEEMTAARRAAFLLGGTVRGTVDAPIPGRDDWTHVLLLTDKTGTTPKAYPRKAGTPNRKPLGQ